MKRLVAVMLVACMTVGSVLGLSGCEQKQLEVMTKGQWAQKIAQALQMDSSEVTEQIYADVGKDSTYFNAVQNCAAWDIFDKNGNFEPDKEATVDFAIASAIRAVGEDKIARSSYAKTLQTDDDRIDFFHSISDMDYISGGALYPEWADQIIQDMNTVFSSLELKQQQDIGLKDQCVEAGDHDVIFSADGKTGTIQNDELSVRKGNILVVNPSVLYPEGKTAKITEVNGKRFTYVVPSGEEVLDHVKVSGTYKPKIIGVVPMSDDVEIQEINGSTAVAQKCPVTSSHSGSLMYVPEVQNKTLAAASLDDLQIGIKGEGEKEKKKSGTASGGAIQGGSAKGSIAAMVGIKDIKVTADIETDWFTVKRAYAAIDSTLNANFHMEGSCEAKTKPLAKVMLSLAGGITLEFQASITMGASGDVTIDWSQPTTIGVEYQKGKGSRFIADTQGGNLTAEANAEAYVTPGLKGIFKVLGFSVASCGAQSGVQVKLNAKAETKKAYYCINLKGYVSLSCFVGGEGEETLLGKLGVKKSWTIWNEENSKFKKEMHIENGKLVKECTHPETSTAPPIKQEEYKKLELPALKMPTFEDFRSSYFGITTPFVALKEKTSDRLPIRVPEVSDKKYSAKDIVCSSSKGEVASVTNDGTITAKKDGTTQIRVATKDGKYQQYIVVHVEGDYSVDFTPLEPVDPVALKRQVTLPQAQAC